MDPNEALKTIRTFTENIGLLDYDNPREIRDALLELAEAVAGLDEWLSKGGFLPDAWQGPGFRVLDERTLVS